MKELTSGKIEELLAAAKRRPELEYIEWDEGEGFETSPPEAAREAASPAPRAIAKLVESDPKTYDALRTRIRDRYIGIRFEGIARGAMDLEDPERVIKAARLAFEEGGMETSLELLELAIEQNPYNEALWLAELEILFLKRNAEGYVRSARGFRTTHPQSKAWAGVVRLGSSLAPGETLFGGQATPLVQDHYGPWPDTPNWIQASWDLTPEILAADFHRAVAGTEEDEAADGDERGA